MSKPLPFVKLSATGNDFILFDNRQALVRGNEAAFFHAICQRRTGIGADGILLIETSPASDFRMRYFNADGFESEMCGNGTRASAYFAVHSGLAAPHARFVVGEDLYEADVDGNFVSVLMQLPTEMIPAPAALEHPGLREGGFATVGVPHYVLFADDLDHVDVDGLGRHYRHHRVFAPRGTNVNFVVADAPDQLRLRTYERGVEEETLACGTGAVATALIAREKLGTHFPVSIQTRGGTLRVAIDAPSKRPLLQGEVKLVFRGVLFPEEFGLKR